MNKVVDDLGDAHDELVSLQAEASVNGLGGECLAHASRETMLSGVGFLLEDVRVSWCICGCGVFVVMRV